MDINLTVDPSEHIRIFVNGNLAGEIVVGAMHDRASLAQEVATARRLEALPKIFRGCLKSLIDGQDLWEEGMKKESCRTEFSKGLLEGFMQKRIPYPVPSAKLPSIRPPAGRSYNNGYDYGAAIADILDAIEKADA